MKVEEAINKAIEAGFEQKYAHYAKWEHQAETLLDRSFWESLGTAMGWGEWTKKYEEVKHAWEIAHYLPDTARTPVFICSKCDARKINGVIEVEYEYEWYEVGKKEWAKRDVLKWHGGMIRPSWKEYWHRFIDYLADGKTVEDFFANLN